MHHTPGSSTAIGIDLGTTFSVVAYLDENGRPQTLSNSDGDPTTPSVVLLEDGEVVVGKEAVKASSLEPHAVAQFMKRDIGKPEFWKSIHGTAFPPEVLQALVLRKLRQDTIDRLGQCDDVVITVPAYFNEPRRKATQDAGRLAGLNVLDIINEPTAAAIAYGVGQGFVANSGAADTDETIMVYDLGGGTFDVSIMRIEGNAYTVLATDGNVQLGGIDFDRCLANRIAEEFTANRVGDPRKDAGAQQKMLREAEEAKRALSARESATVSFEFSEQGIRFPITRDEFEEITSHLLERTRFTTMNLLRSANISWGGITRVLLVGGSTRMPMVARMLEHESGHKVDRSLAADEAVAHGAAIYAGLLQKHTPITQKNISVTNVCSHSLGVLATERTTSRKKNRIIIPVNTALPFEKTQTFATKNYGQSTVAVNVIQGGDASGNNSTPIGKCVVRELPGTLPARTKVSVSFNYEANGRLRIEAEIPSISRKAAATIERTYGLSDQQIAMWTARIDSGDMLAEPAPSELSPGEEQSGAATQRVLSKKIGSSSAPPPIPMEPQKPPREPPPIPR
jgi:molecular chaperone DnaK